MSTSAGSAARSASVASVGRGGLRGVIDALARRPQLAVGVVALLVAVGHSVWIWNTRHMGAFDADESGYIADALRYHRALLDHGPMSLLSEIRYSGTAPLVPLLSLPFLLVGPDDPRTVMLVQPLLMVVAAVAITGITTQLTKGSTAVLAGVAFIVFPTTLLAAQSYWFGLGVAAMMALALWALMESGRGTNRWIWAVGPAFGAMLLARTMAIGFIPAVLLAGVVLVGLDPRRLGRLAATFAVGFALAAPWYVAGREGIFGYLFSYGYGDRAELFGSASLIGRVLHVPVDLLLGAGAVLPAIVVVSALWLVVTSLRRNGPQGVVAKVRHPRERLVLMTLAAVGVVALMSTANQGGWFSFPLYAAIVPLGAEVMMRSPRPLRFGAALTLAVLGPLLLVGSWWLVPFGTPLPLPTHYEPAFSDYDSRFDSERRPEQPQAAAEWHRLNDDVMTTLREHRMDDGAVFTMAGNMMMFNANTVDLVAQLDEWNPRISVPDTAAPPGELDAELTPEAFDREGDLVERILVIIEHDGDTFTPDMQVDAFAERARDAGWSATRTFDMPVDGSVHIMQFSEQAPSAGS